MAENLNMDEDQFLKSVLKASQEGILKKAANAINFDVFRTFGAEETSKRANCIKTISGSVSSISNQEIKNLQLWNNDILNALETKQLVELANVLSSMVRLSKEINMRETNPILASMGITADLKNSLKVTEDAIKALADNFISAGIVKLYSQESLTQEFGDLDKGKRPLGREFVSNADLEIVAALKLAGVDLLYNETTGKWSLPTDFVNMFAMNTPDGNNPFTFERSQVEGLVENYLNVPQSQRNGNIVSADGLLKVFMQTVKGSIDKKDPVIRDQLRLSLASQERIYNSNSDEFKLAYLLDNNTVNRLAQKQAIANLYKMQLDAIDLEELPSQYPDDLSEEMDGCKSLASKEFLLKKNLEKLERSADDNLDFIANNKELSKVNFLEEYNALIGRLEKRKTEPGMSEKLAALHLAREKFSATVAFQQEYAQQYLNDNSRRGLTASQKIVSVIEEASQYDIESLNNGEVKLVDMKTTNDKTNSVIDAIRARVAQRNQAKQANSAQQPNANQPAEANAQPTSNNTNKSTMPNIFYKFSEVITDMDGYGQEYRDALNGVMNDGIAGFLFRPGQPLDIAYNEFIKANPGKTFDDFVGVYTAKAPECFLDAESLKAGFALNHPDKADEIGFDKDRAQKLDKSFKEKLVLLDLATQDMTAMEVKDYLNETYPAGARYKLIEQKILNAKNKLNQMSQSEYDKAEKIAEQRLKNGVLKQYLSMQMPDIIKSEEELGKGDFLSKALDSYINELGQEQEKNNQALIKNGEMVVDPDKQIDMEAEQGSNEQQYIEKKYKELYPSGPNLNKFLKKMKPYNGKAIVKTFLEPLIDGIENKTVRIPVSGGRPVASVADPDVQKVKDDNQNSPANGSENADPENSTEDTSKQSEPTPEEKPVLTQRIFEASNFMPGYQMLAQLTDPNNGPFKNYPVIRRLKDTLGYMCSTDEIANGDELCKKNDAGRDFRDELRTIAIEVCGGKYKNSEEVKKALDNAANVCGVNKDNKKLEEIKLSFDLITPEMLDFIFQTTSEVKDKNTLVVGANLPAEELAKATNDQERRAIMKEFFEGRDLNKDSADMLGMLLTEIYRNKSKNVSKEIQKGFGNQQFTAAQFEDIVKKLEEQNNQTGATVSKEEDEPEM